MYDNPVRTINPADEATQVETEQAATESIQKVEAEAEPLDEEPPTGAHEEGGNLDTKALAAVAYSSISWKMLPSIGTWLIPVGVQYDNGESIKIIIPEGPTLRVFRQHHLAPLKKLPLVAKRGPQWQTVTRIIHHCAISGEKVFDATVTDENRNETSLWNGDCDFPGGLTTEIFYSGERLSPPGERYIERARLKRERKKQRYEENESQRIKTTMRVWFLHEWNIPVRSGNYQRTQREDGG